MNEPSLGALEQPPQITCSPILEWNILGALRLLTQR